MQILRPLRALSALSVVLLCSCATHRSETAALPPVRQISFRGTPEMKPMEAHTREFCNEMYPKIVAFLVEDTAAAPRQFSITFKKHLWNDNAGEVFGDRMYLSARWLGPKTNEHYWFGNNRTNFDIVLVHEMGHVAQKYRSGPFYMGEIPRWWEEGIADYVRFKMGYTNGWGCPQCNEQISDYHGGQWCAGAFLLYLEANYGTNIVRQLNTAIYRRRYSENFFVEKTGKSLSALWADFQQTPAVTPFARDLNRLHEELGFRNDKPPRDLRARYAAYITQHHELDSLHDLFDMKDGLPSKNIDAIFKGYLVLKNHPGGEISAQALNFLSTLHHEGNQPGWMKGDDGMATFDPKQNGDSDNYPVTRTILCRKKGDDSMYHYVVVCERKGEPWKLQKAWQTSKDGKVRREFPITEDPVR